MTWKEWLEEKNVPGERLPSELQCHRYALISRYPGVLAMFREAMKGKPGPKSAISSCNNVTPLGNGKGTGNARAYSVTRVQQECKPEVVSSVTQPWHLAANRKQKDPTPGAAASGLGLQ